MQGLIGELSCLDLEHPGKKWPVIAFINHLVKGGVIALKDGLDRTVKAIANPSGKATRRVAVSIVHAR